MYAPPSVAEIAVHQKNQSPHGPSFHFLVDPTTPSLLLNPSPHSMYQAYICRLLGWISTSPSLRHTTLPPLLPRPVPHHTLPRRQIAISKKRRNVHVQRGVGLRIRQELVDSGERRGKRVDGTPVFRREESETDLAGREGDVRVRYAGCEVDCRGCKGIVWWDCDSEVPKAAWGGGVRLLVAMSVMSWMVTAHYLHRVSRSRP